MEQKVGVDWGQVRARLPQGPPGPWSLPAVLLPCSAPDATPGPAPSPLPGHRSDPTSSHCRTAAGAGPCQEAGSWSSAERTQVNGAARCPHPEEGKAGLRTPFPPGPSVHLDTTANKEGSQRRGRPAVSPSYSVVWLNNVLQTIGHGINLVCQDYLYSK